MVGSALNLEYKSVVIFERVPFWGFWEIPYLSGQWWKRGRILRSSKVYCWIIFSSGPLPFSPKLSKALLSRKIIHHFLIRSQRRANTNIWANGKEEEDPNIIPKVSLRVLLLFVFCFFVQKHPDFPEVWRSEVWSARCMLYEDSIFQMKWLHEFPSSLVSPPNTEEDWRINHHTDFNMNLE